MNAMSRFDEVMKLYQEGYTLDQIVETMQFTSRKTLTNLIGRAGYKTINGQILPKDNTTVTHKTQDTHKSIQKSDVITHEKDKDGTIKDILKRLERLEKYKSTQKNTIELIPMELELVSWSTRINKDTLNKFDSLAEQYPMVSKGYLLSMIIEKYIEEHIE